MNSRNRWKGNSREITLKKIFRSGTVSYTNTESDSILNSKYQKVLTRKFFARFLQKLENFEKKMLKLFKIMGKMGVSDKAWYEKIKDYRTCPISPDIKKSSLSDMSVSTDKYVIFIISKVIRILIGELSDGQRGN